MYAFTFVAFARRALSVGRAILTYRYLGLETFLLAIPRVEHAA